MKAIGKLYAYAIAITAVVLTSVLGSYFTKMGVKSAWYEKNKAMGINKTLTPPSWVFPVVWTTLYAIIAWSFAGALMNRNLDLGFRVVVWLFVINLILNVVWCWAFFGARRVKLALGVLFLTWLTAIAIMVMQKGPWVLGLYVAWLSYAMVLNMGFVSVLN